jgi:hypothetical protein
MQGEHLAGRRVGFSALACFGYVGVLCQPVKILGNVYDFRISCQNHNSQPSKTITVLYGR